MRLLLDEMFSAKIARQLRKRGYDAEATCEPSEFRALPDRELLAEATRAGRVVVTENVQHLLPLHRELTAAGAGHRGLIFTSHRRYPRTARDIGKLVRALAALCDQEDLELSDRVHWLQGCRRRLDRRTEP